MNSPFKKQDNSALIAGIIISSVAAGTIAYLFTTENGNEVRKQLKEKLNGFFDKLMEKPETDNHPGHVHHESAYQNRRKVKAPKSDREKILKHEILGHHDTPGHKAE